MEKISEMDHIKAIAEVNSISVAAEKLGISQPALSSYLKKKEREFGTVLFDRSKQPLQLTESGKAYLDYVAKVSAAEKEFHQVVADLEDLKTGKLTIGGASFLNISYLPEAVASFRKLYPNVELDIVDGMVPEITTAAWNGTVDLFLTPSKEDEDRFHYDKIAEETMFLAVPKDWDINKKLADKAVREDGEIKYLTEQEFRDLCECPFVELSQKQAIGKKMEELFERFGCRPEQIIKAEQAMTTIAMTVAGVGVSMISQCSPAKSQFVRDVVLYVADSEMCHRELYIAYPNNKYLSKAAEEFIKIIKDLI